MDKVELVLTGTDSLLPESSSTAVYLAPWCFFNNRYSLWQNRSEKILPDPFVHQEDRAQAILQVGQLLDRLWEPLASYCNQQVGSQRSVIYWQSVLGHWALEFVTILHERWQRVELAVHHLKGQEVLVKLMTPREMRPVDHVEYYSWSAQHDFNLCVLSDLVRFRKPANWILKEIPDVDFSGMQKYRLGSRMDRPHPLHLQNETKKASPVKQLKKWIKSLDFCPEIYLGNIHGMDETEKWHLKLRMSSWSWPRRQPQVQSQKACESPQAVPLQYAGQNDFERFVAGVLTSYLPTELLQDLRFRSTGRIKYFIGNDIYNFPGKALLGQVRENGGRWISVQHGGGYGILKDLPMGYLEYKLSDGFISWGWSYPDNLFNGRTIKPLPSAYLSLLKENIQRKESPTKIFYVTTAVPFYTYRYDRVAAPELQWKYFLNIQKFFSGLSEATKNKIFIKSYHYDFMLKDLEFFKSFQKPQNVMDVSSSLVKLYPDTALVIIDHYSTSFLESLSFDVPTLLVVDENIGQPMAEAQPDLQLLKDAGIVQTQIGSAQKLLAEFQMSNGYERVQVWWNEPHRKQAVREFCRRQAWTEEDWEKRWVISLKNLQRRGTL